MLQHISVDKETIIKEPSTYLKLHTQFNVSALNRHTIRPFTDSDVTRCCNNTIWPPEDEHSTARNMSRIIIWHIYCYRMKELCIKLVIETSLYCDTRSEKHQITVKMSATLILCAWTLESYWNRVDFSRDLRLLLEWCWRIFYSSGILSFVDC